MTATTTSIPATLRHDRAAMRHPLSAALRQRVVRRVMQRHLANDPHRDRLTPVWLGEADSDATDLLFVHAADPHEPPDMFHRLRWGGQMVFVSAIRRHAEAVARQYEGQGGFVLDEPVRTLHLGPFGLPLPLPGVTRQLHYFIARRVLLVPPGEVTDRFTFNVRLVRHRDGADGPYGVVKQVPSATAVLQRLKDKYPDTDLQVLVDRARKLVDHVFPVFLTREAGFLKLLERDLAPAYRDRVPRVISMEKDARGLVTKLHLNWLRMGGEPLDQLTFARQASELLRVLHDEVGIIHLDLRLDNVVITPQGVCFVDFGSAVRVGEDLSESPMLLTLFDEMMSTSQIQRVLGHMKDTGRVTSQAITAAHHKVDKAVDVFYLAVQINRPHMNPDLKHLITHEPTSEQARRISLLTDAVLRPKDPRRPGYISAADLHQALCRIERKLTDPGRPTPRRAA